MSRPRLHLGAIPFLVAAIMFGALAPIPPEPTQASSQSGWNWYKTDTHVHGAISGDGLDDMGILAAAGQARGYDVLFLTDHQAGSNFPIGSVIANHVVFDDDLGSKWTPEVYGSLSTNVNGLVSNPVKTGTKSLHLKGTSSSSGETFELIKRGPNLRSGNDILKFSVYPTAISAGSGLYVSVSLGGDVTVQEPEGYTTQDDAVHPGRTTVLVWQLGSPRVSVSDPEARVVVSNLSYSLNQWNTYTINVNDAVNTALTSAGQKPVDYNALSQIKMSAMASGGGTAEGYFDDFHIDASVPVPGGDEFVYRNTKVAQFNTASFKIYPSIEMGYNRHAQRFNFGITAASEYNSFFGCTSQGASCTLTRGLDAILPAQQTGYPAQLNHPAFPGGVSEQEALDTHGGGADVMEVREPLMITVWDEILNQPTILPGTWSSDMHKVKTLDVAGRGAATYIYSPTIGFDDLMRSMYEGRMYLAGHSFPGQLIFNLDPSSSEPYPSRYPVSVSSAQSSANVHLKITAGIGAGYKVVWIRNGVSYLTEPVGGSSYESTKSIPVGGAFTYIRAELQDAGGKQMAMSEPIFFFPNGSLASGMSYRTDAVSTPSGLSYTKLAVKGISAGTWNGGSQSLSLTLDNPANSLVESTVGAGAFTPSSVTLNGTPLAASASLSAFYAATTSTWFYDAGSHQLHTKAKPSGSTATLLAQFGGSSDTQDPTTPGGLAGSAVSGSEVDLSWNAATDNVAVTGYSIYRGGALLDTVSSGQLTYVDTSVVPNTAYSYQVDAFDAAGNHSPLSAPVGVTTPSVASVTFTPIADTYVDASKPTTNFGTNTALRADASPIVQSYLRFNVQGGGGITRATLRVYANSASSSGISGRSVNNSGSWAETTLNYGNAPGLGTTNVGASGPAAAGAWLTVDVSPLVTGTGTVDIGIATPGSTALSLGSRESANDPELIVEFSTGGSDSQPPSIPSGVTATALSSSSIRVDWSASTDNVGVTSYTVYRGGAPVGTVNGSTLTFTNTGLSPSTPYSYTVEAFDAAANPSGQSSPPASATTQASDSQPPSIPSGVTATALSSSSIRVDWSASTDNVGVTSYTVYRGGAPVGTVNGSTLTFTNTGLSPSTPYSYTVEAFDAAANPSGQSSPPATATTQAGSGSLTFTPTADSYVDSSKPSTNFGSSTAIRVDGLPDVQTYLRFNVQIGTGTISRVTLRIFANTGSSAGLGARSVLGAWAETTLNYSNAPGLGASNVGSSTSAVAGTWLTIDVTALVTGNGDIDIGVITAGTTAISLASRESANDPQLVVEFSP